MPFVRRSLAVAIFATLALAGCGGISSDGPAAASSPVPAPTPSVSPAANGFTLLAVGDIGYCSGRGAEITARLADRLLADPGSGVVRLHTLGDNVQGDGSEAEYRSCFAPAWGQFRDILYPAVGNHDWTLADPYYFTYFGARAVWNGKDGYYSYAEGAWLVLVLNSELLFDRSMAAKQAEQMAFVVRELAAHPDKRVLAIFHRPRWGHGENGDTPAVQAFLDGLVGRVAITLHGHEHHYERFYPLNPRGERDDARGFRSFVVGTGGGKLYDFRGVRCNKSEFRNVGKDGKVTDFGILRLRLRNDGSYSWEYFIWPDGSPNPVVADSDRGAGSETCP